MDTERKSPGFRCHEWRVCGPSKYNPPCSDGGDYAIVDAENHIIAEVISQVDHGVVEPAREKARFIVRACQAHADLLAACEEAKRVLYSVDVHATAGLIPLLEHLRTMVPEPEQEAIDQAIDQLRHGEDGEGYGHPDTALAAIEPAIAKARGAEVAE